MLQMELSDILAIMDIVVTVLIGFVITHMVSVRDSRTRAIKDYFIRELSDIKSEINAFYTNLYKGELDAKEIIGWYMANRNRIEIFDDSIRKTFRIYESRIGAKLFNNYSFITNSTDYNSNYSKGKIVFEGTTKRNIGFHQKKLYGLIEQTLYDINNVRARDYLERKCQEFGSHYHYYKDVLKKTKWKAFFSTVKDWFNSHKVTLFVLILLIVLVFYIVVRLLD